MTPGVESDELVVEIPANFTLDTSNQQGQLEFTQNESLGTNFHSLFTQMLSSFTFLQTDSSNFHFSSESSLSTHLISENDHSNSSIFNNNNNDYEFYQNSSNDGFFPPQQTVQFSIGFQVIIYIIYNTVFVAALLGNILVCYVVFSSPRMRTVTNYLIANLAVGDLLMALLCVPFSYISVLLQYWPFGKILCHLVAPAQAVCVFVSSYTLVALAGDRYVAILYPLKPRLRRSQAVIVIFIVWIIAILTAIPIAIYTDMITVHGNPECTEVWPNETHKLVYSLTLMGLQYFFPLTVLIFTYTRIAIAVWGKKAPGEAEDARDQRLAKAKRKTVVMTLAVVIGYSLAWLPVNTVNLILGLYPPAVENPPELFIYLYFGSHWLAMAHTTYNPLIYAWINARFRSAFKQVLSKVRCSLPCHRGLCRPKKRLSRSPRHHHRHSNTPSLGYSTSLNRTRNTIVNNGSHRICHLEHRVSVTQNGSPIWT